MKADQEKLTQAILENLSKPKEERLTQRKLGEIFGVTGPRISQIASGLKVKPLDIPTPTQEPAEAPEA